jgi:hypothetical protein
MANEFYVGIPEPFSMFDDWQFLALTSQGGGISSDTRFQVVDAGSGIGGIYIANRWSVGAIVNLKLKMLVVPPVNVVIWDSEGDTVDAEVLGLIGAGSSTSGIYDVTFTAQHEGILITAETSVTDIEYVKTTLIGYDPLLITVEELQEAKPLLADIITYTYSTDDTFIDSASNTRLTLTGYINQNKI